ncbi:MAG TPA: hypothetical protein DCP92_24755 [Nitrospiraceae bacterium]|nr:hypothetical protein [Nitrospiraceae bacterium]
MKMCIEWSNGDYECRNIPEEEVKNLRNAFEYNMQSSEFTTTAGIEWVFWKHARRVIFKED